MVKKLTQFHVTRDKHIPWFLPFLYLKTAYIQLLKIQHRHLQQLLLKKKRQGPIHEMEKLLMENVIKKCTPISLLTIQSKAKSLFNTLKEWEGEDYKENYQAKNRCFQHFKKV